jgi:hypothetical protein
VRLLSHVVSCIPSSPCSILPAGSMSASMFARVVEKILDAYVFTRKKIGSGEIIFFMLSKRRGKEVSNSHFSPLAPCQKTGGSIIKPSYVFPRRTSRSTNLTTSSSIQRIESSGSSESSMFFCAQPIVGFEPST